MLSKVWEVDHVSLPLEVFDESNSPCLRKPMLICCLDQTTGYILNCALEFYPTFESVQQPFEWETTPSHGRQIREDLSSLLNEPENNP